MNASTAPGGIALILFLTFGSAFAKHSITASDEREIWCPKLNDEAHGLFFFASGTGNTTFNVASSYEDCDSIMAAVSLDRVFVTDQLWARGFTSVSRASTVDGNVQARTQKIGPIPERKPLPKPNHRESR